MIGPVSGTGRAMMASLQQAIQKGMPPDQAIQYVKSMATQGVAPLTDLYAMMNQFQRLKQQPVQAPQTPPTIRDQLNMAEQQQAQQQMAMQQGLGGLPAPAMEQAQFAGGGIVAFDEGGPVGDVESEITRLEEALRTDDYIKQGSGGSLGRVMTTRTMPMGYAQRLEAERKLERLKSMPRPKVKAEPDFLPSGPPVKSEFKLPSNYGSPQQPAEQGAAPDIFAVPSGTRGPVTRREAPPTPRTDTTSRGGIDSRVPAAPRVAAAPVVAAPEDISPEALIKRTGPAAEALAKWRESQGIGQADKEMATFLSDENNRLSEQFGRDRSLAFAEAGFKMAAAASRPGATFLGAFSEGAISGTQALRGLNKEMDANRRSMKEAMLKLRQAEEARKEGDFKTAMQMDQQYRTELFERKKHADAMTMDERRLQTVIRGQNLDYGAATMRALTQGDGRSSSGAIAVIKMQVEGLDLDYKDQQEIANDMTRTVAERQQARALMGQIRKQRDQLVSGATLSGTGESRNPLSGFSATEED